MPRVGDPAGSHGGSHAKILKCGVPTACENCQGYDKYFSRIRVASPKRWWNGTGILSPKRMRSDRQCSNKYIPTANHGSLHYSEIVSEISTQNRMNIFIAYPKQCVIVERRICFTGTENGEQQTILKTKVGEKVHRPGSCDWSWRRWVWENPIR